MNIFLTQTHGFASEGLYKPCRAAWSSFIMDWCTFMDFIKHGRARILVTLQRR